MQTYLKIFIVFLVIVLFLRLFLFYTSNTAYKDGQYLGFKTSITTQPKIYPTYQTFFVETQTGERVLVKTKPETFYQYGDNLSISGNLRIRLLNNRQFLDLDFPKISLISQSNLAIVNLIRQKISESFHTVLSQDDAALLLGIVFGIKENMSQNFLNQLKTVGVMHVIAASGMNITMTAGFIFYIFSLVFKRQIATSLTMMGIVFYALIAGFQASIIRASVMAIIAFTAQGIGKQVYSLYALFLTGFIMLFLWPKFLVDIGFQLSFLSTLGIILIPRLFSRLQSLISTDFLTTICAQMATFPIIISNFGTYSLWSVLVNLLVLWTVPFLMILGGLAAIFSILEPVSKLFLLISIPLLSYFETVVSYFTNLGGVLKVTEIPWPFIFSYYLFLLSAVIFTYKKSSKNSNKDVL